MADGTYKPVEELKPGDAVMVFNHMTGKMDTGIVAVNTKEPNATDAFIMALNFSNGRTVRISMEHGFFDVDLNKYVYISENNYEEFIGHRFCAVKGNGSIEKEIVTLESVDTYYESGVFYSPESYKHLNLITEDVLSIGADIRGLFNIFELDENMKVIPELMQKDIETYGLYTYEDWAPYLTEAEFEAFNAKYLKISFGKGITTLRNLLIVIKKYLHPDIDIEEALRFIGRR